MGRLSTGPTSHAAAAATVAPLCFHIFGSTGAAPDAYSFTALLTHPIHTTGMLGSTGAAPDAYPPHTHSPTQKARTELLGSTGAAPLHPSHPSPSPSQARTELLGSTGAAPDACVCSRVDLEDLASVRAFAAEQRQGLLKGSAVAGGGGGDRLDILVNNAGTGWWKGGG